MYIPALHQHPWTPNCGRRIAQPSSSDEQKGASRSAAIAETTRVEALRLRERISNLSNLGDQRGLFEDETLFPVRVRKGSKTARVSFVREGNTVNHFEGPFSTDITLKTLLEYGELPLPREPPVASKRLGSIFTWKEKWKLSKPHRSKWTLSDLKRKKRPKWEAQVKRRTQRGRSLSSLTSIFLPEEAQVSKMSWQGGEKDIKRGSTQGIREKDYPAI